MLCNIVLRRQSNNVVLLHFNGLGACGISSDCLPLLRLVFHSDSAVLSTINGLVDADFLSIDKYL